MKTHKSLAFSIYLGLAISTIQQVQAIPHPAKPVAPIAQSRTFEAGIGMSCPMEFLLFTAPWPRSNTPVQTIVDATVFKKQNSNHVSKIPLAQPCAIKSN